MNICSYHLQEAGATPVQELAFALATAIAVLDRCAPRPGARGGLPPGRRPHLVLRQRRHPVRHRDRKMRAFVELWDEITRERYGVEDPKLRRFRYGVQVNSLGLTEQQPENNVYRILIEMLAVTLSKKARARAVQLPAWNEALGLPRPWDQQWSLRMQQIMAYETDLLEYDDLFDGSHVIERKVEELKAEIRAELARIDAMGGAVAARIEAGETVVVGVNRFTSGRAEPADRWARTASSSSDPEVEADQIARLEAWRAQRDGSPSPPRSTTCAPPRARAATSCRRRSPPPGRASRPANGARRCARSSASTARRPASARPRARCAAISRRSARRSRP
jgi:ethylmalonyl-CoA mutase